MSHLRSKFTGEHMRSTKTAMSAWFYSTTDVDSWSFMAKNVEMLFLNILIECFDKISEFDVMRVLCTELEKEEFQN